MERKDGTPSPSPHLRRMTTFIGSDAEEILNETKYGPSWDNSRSRRIIRPPLPIMKPLHKSLENI